MAKTITCGVCGTTRDLENDGAALPASHICTSCAVSGTSGAAGFNSEAGLVYKVYTPPSRSSAALWASGALLLSILCFWVAAEVDGWWVVLAILTGGALLFVTMNFVSDAILPGPEVTISTRGIRIGKDFLRWSAIDHVEFVEVVSEGHHGTPESRRYRWGFHCKGMPTIFLHGTTNRIEYINVDELNAILARHVDVHINASK